MKERMAGFLVMTAIVPMAIAGYLLLVLIGLGGPTARGRAGVRALDHFVNATLFNGYAWESVSSHAWRAREQRWARGVIWLTDRVQPGHDAVGGRFRPLTVLLLEHARHLEDAVGVIRDGAEGVHGQDVAGRRQ